MPKALLLVALLLLAGGPIARAGTSPWKALVQETVAGMTLDEIIQWSDGEYRRKAALGRYVRWAGIITFTSGLIYAALDYFYGYLKRETVTPLDQWYHFDYESIAIAAIYPNSSGLCYKDSKGWYQVWWLNRRENLDPARPWLLGYSHNIYLSGGCPSDPVWGTAAAVLSGAVNVPGYKWVGPLYSRSFRRDVMLYVSGDRPPLPEWLRDHPTAAAALRDQVLQPYIEAAPLGSPANPVPGVSLDPVPSPNQWTDNPFTRPDLDTDGDGWPDSVEWYEANRRGVPWPDLINNPDTYPDPQADPDGDGYTNQEERQVGTNPYDPASRPQPRPNPGTRTDTDGDGWPDSDETAQGTDPRDPNSRPTGTPPLQDTDGDGVPDVDEISEGTNPNDPNDKPEEKREEEWPGGPPPGELQPVDLPQRDALEKARLPELKEEIWRSFEQNVTQRWQDALRELRDTALDRFPFGLVTVFQLDTTTESASCSFELPIGPYRASVDICSTPIWQAATTFRPILAGLVWAVALLALIRRGLDVQK